MLDELIGSNAVDKRWAEELIADSAMLEDLERAAIGTADNRWRIPRFNGRACVDEARHMARMYADGRSPSRRVISPTRGVPPR